MASDPKKSRAVSASADVAETNQAESPRFAPVADDADAQNLNEARRQAEADHAARNAAMAQQASAPRDTAPTHLFVVDRSATHHSGARTHELLDSSGVLKPYKFEPYTPNKLPLATAIRFLASEGFVLTDEEGNEQPFRKTPKRPEDLAAGEKLTLQQDETVARYDELSTKALFFRCAVLPGGDAVAQANNRDAMIQFIVAHYAALNRSNSEREKRYGADAGLDDFTPPAEADFY